MIRLLILLSTYFALCGLGAPAVSADGNVECKLSGSHIILSFHGLVNGPVCDRGANGHEDDAPDWPGGITIHIGGN